MTGSCGFSHVSAAAADTKRGRSIAGMPSFGGPPDTICVSGTLCREKSVFHPAVSNGALVVAAEPMVPHDDPTNTRLATNSPHAKPSANGPRIRTLLPIAPVARRDRPEPLDDPNDPSVREPKTNTHTPAAL